MPLRAHLGGKAFSRASFSIAAAAFLRLSTSLAVGVANQLHRLFPPSYANTATPQYLVLFVLDGGEPGYLHVTRLPHLDALRAHGVEYDRAWADILESETPSGHAAISTGSTPVHDGLLGFNWIKTTTIRSGSSIPIWSVRA